MAINVVDLGAQAKGHLATKAIQKAIDQAADQGGGQVTIPAGHFLTGSIELKSNVELHLEAGAILKFSDDPIDFPVIDSRWEGVSRQVYRPCIYAHQATNIAITGLGTLDGNGAKWWHIFREERDKLVYPRPQFIGFDDCERVLLENFQIKDSPSWTVHPVNCQNVTINNISIKNPIDSPNTDGIDPESCRNVRISNCQIDVGDDCIALKSGTEQNASEKIACENITISNCTLLHGHGAIVLGSEMSGGIQNVTISNCTFEQTDRGIRLKSRRGRGGVIKNFVVSNIIMNEVLCPFVFNLFYFCGPNGRTEYVADKRAYPVTEKTPRFTQFQFSNIIAQNVRSAAGYIYGLPEQLITDVTFSHVQIRMASGATPEKPAMMADIKPMTQRGFFVNNARNITFDHVQIENYVGEPFMIRDAPQVKLINETTQKD
ncbi:glycoside hydrolase family 28 protein [Lapidilactobacillus luobeiensis]|uniref:glycoside hydrolase family 28 protein n=1 Tax=Lapidilactobacillus luobeiensis TaxID=2950371 RepID=UPI0021C2C098|nr:glycoside hydrolase family 28 protein [Lapidilactobacillus luobeiensis]